jgi:hypothetical protein
MVRPLVPAPGALHGGEHKAYLNPPTRDLPVFGGLDETLVALGYATRMVGGDRPPDAPVAAHPALQAR